MIMHCLFRRIVLTLGVTALVAGMQAANAELPHKASENFGIYRYEMVSDPAGQDLDGNGTSDFHEVNDGSSPLPAFADGFVTIPRVDSNYGNTYNSDTAAQAWLYSGVSKATGWTLEIRLKTDTAPQDPNNLTRSIGIWAGAAYGPAAPGVAGTAVLSVDDAHLYWGHPSIQPAIQLDGTFDNKSDYHVYRIAAIPGAYMSGSDYSVWRDGVLLSSNLDSVFPYWAPQLQFGDIHGGVHGTTGIDYVRFTTGAFAPTVPSPTTLALLAAGMTGLLACARRKR